MVSQNPYAHGKTMTVILYAGLLQPFVQDNLSKLTKTYFTTEWLQQSDRCSSLHSKQMPWHLPV